MCCIQIEVARCVPRMPMSGSVSAVGADVLGFTDAGKSGDERYKMWRDGFNRRGNVRMMASLSVWG